jgi:hypothetical protein
MDMACRFIYSSSLNLHSAIVKFHLMSGEGKYLLGLLLSAPVMV